MSFLKIMSINELVGMKANFIGKILEVGPRNLAKERKTLEDLYIWQNAIVIRFSDVPGGEVVLPHEEITNISLTQQGFYISSPILCVASV